MGPEVVVPVSVFACIFGCVYVAVTAWHRQRMAMIEKGTDPRSLGFGRNRFLTLKFGMLALGVGLGWFAGYFLDKAMFSGADQWNPSAYFIMILIFGGAALISHHLIVQRKQQG